MTSPASLPSSPLAPPLPLVVQTEELDEAAAAYLAEHTRLVVCDFKDVERFGTLLKEAAGLVVRTYTRVDRALLDRAPNLKVVGRAGVGLDRIDVAECRRRGVEVVHTPDANSQAVAEYVFALLFDAMRPRVYLEGAIDDAEWGKLRKRLTAPRQISDLVFGIWGLGRIGTRVARIAGAIGAEVIYNDLLDISPDLRGSARPVSRDELLRTADVLSLHIDPRPANHRILSTPTLSLLKRNAIIINTARGVLADALALSQFLKANPDAAAWIDVHDPEPISADYPLIGLPNAHISPHIAAATAGAHANMSWVVRDVVRVLRGEQPRHPAPR